MSRRHEPVLILPRARYGKDRRRWLDARRQGITATDAAAILAVDPWRSPLSLYVEKVHGAGEVTSEKAYWGTQLEHVVAVEWGKRHRADGLRVVPTPGLLAHPDMTWMMATLDRYVGERRYAIDGRAEVLPVAVLECKTTDARNREAWPEDGSPPLRVIAQATHQLIVTGLDLAHVAVLIGGNTYREWDISYDPELADALIGTELDFRDRIAQRVPPAPIGLDSDDEALDRLFTAAPGTTAEVPAGLLEQYRAAQQAEKDAEAARKALAQQIKFTMGDATEGVVGGRLVATYRPAHRGGYSVAATDYRALRLVKAKGRGAGASEGKAGAAGLAGLGEAGPG
jgi:putative phage-type endonuclease